MKRELCKRRDKTFFLSFYLLLLLVSTINYTAFIFLANLHLYKLTKIYLYIYILYFLTLFTLLVKCSVCFVC